MTHSFPTRRSSDLEHSLDWLLTQDIDAEGPMAYQQFEKTIGALAMGASTYEWVLDHEQGVWGYSQPTWVFTHRELAIPDGAERSEEHTSELQSLMRNSYAVFCLKNKKINNT